MTEKKTLGCSQSTVKIVSCPSLFNEAKEGYKHIKPITITGNQHFIVLFFNMIIISIYIIL